MRALADLLAANEAHADRVHGSLGYLQGGQHPEVVTVCCPDSRVLQDDMWNNAEPGRVFTCGNIGNRAVRYTDAGQSVTGDLLYPLAHTGTETAVVVGHTGCGAVTATYEDLTGGIDELPGIRYCIDQLAASVEPGIERLPDGLDDRAAVDHLVEYNVDRQVDALVESDDVPEDVTAVGAVYDLHGVYGDRRGEVHVVNVDGERDPEALREAYPEVDEYVDRHWRY